MRTKTLRHLNRIHLICAIFPKIAQLSDALISCTKVLLFKKMKYVFVLTTILLPLLLDVTVGERQYKVLKFGNSISDYIMYRPDMGPLQNAFSVCSWVRSLNTNSHPTWMSYAVSGSDNEVFVSADGYFNMIFDSYNVYLQSHLSGLAGTWYHYCMTWNYSSRTRRIYLNGQQIHTTTTSSGRRLPTGGYLVIGNDQNGDDPGTSGFGADYIFGGELYKLNLFSKELSSSEVLEMSRDKCSEIELTYGDVRSIKWEEILQRSRNGDVREIASGCSASELWDKLSETLEELRNSSQLLNETRSELARVKEEKAAKDTEMVRREQQLNETLEDLAQTRINFDTKEQQLNETLEDLAQTRTNLATKEQQLNETLEDLAQTRTNLKTNEQQLNETLEALAQTRKEKEAHETSLDTKRQHLNETLDELESTENEKDMCHTDLVTAEENLNTTTTEKEEALEELERKKEDLIRITTTLNQTQTELDHVRKLLEKANNTPPDCPLNSTITSYWDLLYSEDYFGDVISSEKLEVLYKSVEKLGKY